MFILMGKANLFIPDSHSLKDKRMVIKSLGEKLKYKYKLSFAETGEHHKWQRTEIGIAAVSREYTYLEVLENMVKYFILDNYPVEILDWDFEIIKK
ncbi:MAG: DUF503 domain-containing protein [Clostridia bacterium]|nr:DUF503 domain-containing protein [Clostridia bacterium]